MKIGVVVLLIAMVLQNVFGFDVAPVVAGIGVLGLAMSLAAKDSIKNVFGALMIFLYRPFVLGDHVRFEGQIGTVMELGTQSTTIRLLTGERLTVPNMKFVSSSIENLSARPYVRGEVEVALSYHCSTRELERALELLRQIMRTGPVATEGMFRLGRAYLLGLGPAERSRSAEPSRRDAARGSGSARGGAARPWGFGPGSRGVPEGGGPGASSLDT